MVKLGKLIGQLGILLLSVIQTIAIAQSSQEVTRDQVSFGSVLSDSEISTVINRYNVKPKAVFIWMSGLSATHRVDEDLSVEEIIESARTQTETFILNSIQANNMHIEQFAHSYSSEKIASSESLETQARSLLNIRSQLESALSIVRNDNPMIYGVEVTGEQSSLSRLRLDKSIVKSISASLSNSISIDKSSFKPELYKEEYIDISLSGAESSELHSRMREKISRSPNLFHMAPNKFRDL